MLEVLKNFCRRNPYVGYCQGMNFIVAFFIKMGFSNEVIIAFMSFVHLFICIMNGKINE